MSIEGYLSTLKVDDFNKQKSIDDIEKLKENFQGIQKLQDLYENSRRTTADDVRDVFEGMADLIDVKNKRYGDSVMQPLGVFSSHVHHENTESLNGVLIRLDDKLKRIKNSDELRKNDVSDLIGYLGFLCVDKGWTNFDDLID